MYVLALNCGSSSLKYQVYNADEKTVAASGNVQRIGDDNSFVSYKHGSHKGETPVALPNHAVALKQVMDMLINPEIGVLKSLSEIKAVGHRVVHGGDKFASSVEITDEVIQTLEELSYLAPLHNPANVVGILAAKQVLPDVIQVGVFDTAFHQTMPDFAYRYAVPTSWYRDLGVRRYGFHGTSHLYVSKRIAAHLGRDAKDCNVISLHIGNGASACAIKNGQSVDTSMGLTPLEGLTMGTRSGDLDAAVPFMVKQKLNLTDAEVLDQLNKKSGILGITECFTDRRDVQDNKGTDDRCRLAVDIETYRIKKHIGMYMAALGHVDAIVFTAGAGENDSFLREQAIRGLEELGIKIDLAKNEAALAFRGVGEQVISTDDSKVLVMMIPTNEELVLIEDTLAVANGTYNSNHLEMSYSFLK